MPVSSLSIQQCVIIILIILMFVRGGDPNAEATLNFLHNGLSIASISICGMVMLDIIQQVFVLASYPMSLFNDDLYDGLVQAVVPCNISKPCNFSV